MSNFMILRCAFFLIFVFINHFLPTLWNFEQPQSPNRDLVDTRSPQHIFEKNSSSHQWTQTDYNSQSLINHILNPIISIFVIKSSYERWHSLPAAYSQSSNSIHTHVRKPAPFPVPKFTSIKYPFIKRIYS